jgi:hypothetical protein
MMTRPDTRIAELEARIAELEKENEELKKENEETVEDEPPKSTKNTKDNCLCVLVEYYEPYAVFKIPNGLDLEDKSIVNEWYVKYGTLHICYTNGKEKEIEWDYMSHKEFDYKWGKGEYRSGKIVSADSYDVYTDNEDSGEEDDSTESTDEDSKEEDKSVWERFELSPKKLSPKALKLAKQWQLDEEDLAQVTPTGANNTIKGDDLTELIEAAKKAWAEESSDESTDEDTDDERRICRTCGFESNDYTDFEHDRCQKCFDEQYQAWRDENGYKSDDPDNERDFYDVLDKRDRDERDKSKNKDKQDK